MTRVLCSADHHFATGTRWEQCLAVHDWMAELVEEIRPDLFVTAGDIYDRASHPVERIAAAKWLQRTANVCPVVGVKGNHDKPHDVELMNSLQARHRICITEDIDVIRLGGVAVALMAWPEPAWLAAQARISGEALDQEARALMRHVLLGLGRELADWNGPRLAVGHWMVDGSVASTGQPLLGMPLNVGLADLALLGADAVVCGHIHKPQGWQVCDTPVIYPGSPHACNWGEAEQKSVVLLEWDEQLGSVRVDRIPTPAARMIHIDAEWPEPVQPGPWALNSPVVLTTGERDGLAGSEVRIRYKTPSDERYQARRAAEQLQDELLVAGALSVKLEQVVTVETRARAPEVAQARTLPHQLQEYWKATGFDPGDRRTELMRKLAELETGS